MTNGVTDILRAGLNVQAVGLLGQNIKGAREILKKKNKPLKTIVGTGVTNIIGIPLLRTQAQLIGSI